MSLKSPVMTRIRSDGRPDRGVDTGRIDGRTSGRTDKWMGEVEGLVDERRIRLTCNAGRRKPCHREDVDRETRESLLNAI